MAVEQRCTDLGANCICSEQLNTDTFNVLQANAFWDPADSTTKECTMTTSYTNAFFESDNFDMQSATSGEMFDALPTLDEGITRLWRSNTGAGGGFFKGHRFPDSAPTGRISLRWYQYFSPAFEFTQGSCLNSGKIVEIQDNNSQVVLVFSNAEGSHQMYGFASGSSFWQNIPDGFDCCSSGPGSAAFDYTTTKMNGKWWRYELVVDNPLTTGDPTRVLFYEKNVTDDDDEELVLDTAGDFSNGIDEWIYGDDLKPDNRIRALSNTTWRNGTCTGYLGFTHYLAAAWDTAAGQRIGAADEVEGAGEAEPLLLKDARSAPRMIGLVPRGR